MRQQILDILPTNVPSLLNFIPGQNRELITTLNRVLHRKEKEKFFYIWGNTGCGKSHLLQAIVNHFIGKQQTAYYFPGEIPQQFEATDDIACLAVDDIERLDDIGQIKLFHIYNQLRDRKFAVFIVSGNVAPSHLNVRPDVLTRLSWGLVYQVHELTENEKIEALQTHALERGFTLELPICQYLLRHSRRDLSSLIMILEELNRYSLIHQRKVTLPLVIKLLQEN
ncbi:MAG: DnaA regulatory inactivator Hda [Nitrosomonas sp.]|nr:DnaA regulatory inactivator Hda [Nitrosomonas sp.]